MHDDTFSRTLNSRDLIEMIDGTKDLMTSYMDDISPNKVLDLDDGDIRNFSLTALNSLYGPNFKYHEVLAYKIEKMAGPATGDSATQNILQKFWIFNSPTSPPIIDIYDSQVIYDKEYTYKLTAYTLVLSHKYKYGDFRLTKQIGKSNYMGDETQLQYCLQFYDPLTMNVSPQLFAGNDLTLPEDSHLRTVVSSMNHLAPNSVEIMIIHNLWTFTCTLSHVLS